MPGAWHDYSIPCYSLLHAEVLLADGRVQDAIEVFSKEQPFYRLYFSSSEFTFYHNMPFMRDMLARALYKNGDIEKAIHEYERLITFDPDNPSRRLIHPKYHYRLAKLYEEKGLNDKAIERYEKFLGFWKDADEDLPEKQDAKVRLARLKG